MLPLFACSPYHPSSSVSSSRVETIWFTSASLPALSGPRTWSKCVLNGTDYANSRGKRRSAYIGTCLLCAKLWASTLSAVMCAVFPVSRKAGKLHVKKQGNSKVNYLQMTNFMPGKEKLLKLQSHILDRPTENLAL